MNIKYYLAILAISISALYPRGAEWRSCTTAVRIEKNLEEGEKWGLKALEKDPDDSYIPYYIGRYIYRPQKRREEAGKMFIKALNRKNTKLDTPFRIGSGKKQVWIKTVHEAITLLGTDWYNYGAESIEKGDDEKGIKYLEMASTFNSKLKGRCYSTIAISYFNTANIERGFKYLDMAIDASDNSKEIIELKLMKLSFLRQQKEFDKAFEIYNTLPKDELSATHKYELVLLHMDNNDCDSAINIGEELFLILEENLSTPMSLISEFAFNLAACFNHKADKKYNEIIDFLSKEIQTDEEIQSKLGNCELSKELYSSAKDYFSLSLGYDENPNQITKDYKKKMRHMIRKIDNDLIPTLEAIKYKNIDGNPKDSGAAPKTTGQ